MTEEFEEFKRELIADKDKVIAIGKTKDYMEYIEKVGKEKGIEINIVNRVFDIDLLRRGIDIFESMGYYNVNILLSNNFPILLYNGDLGISIVPNASRVESPFKRETCNEIIKTFQ